MTENVKIKLDTFPIFAADAQETFVLGCRVFERVHGLLPHQWPEGTYFGTDCCGDPVVDFDGHGIKTASFHTLRNLYR